MTADPAAALAADLEIGDEVLAEAEVDGVGPADLHPGRNRAVLACRCGQVLNTGDMVRIVPPGHPTSSTANYRIGCARCAAAPATSRAAT